MSEDKEESCLKELKQLIEERLKKLFDKDDYLLQFVRGRKYDVDYAFETVKYDFQVRHDKYSYIFENLKPSLVQHIYDQGVFGILKNTDSLGRTIVFYRISKWNAKNVPGVEFERATQLFLKELTSLVKVQQNGVVGMIDYEGFNSDHSKYSGLRDLKRFIDLLHIYPISLGQGFYINASRVHEITYDLAKVFLPRKFKERIFVSRSGFKDLHANISPDILPEWLGGRLKDDDSMDLEIFKRIQDKEELYTNFNEIY